MRQFAAYFVASFAAAAAYSWLFEILRDPDDFRLSIPFGWALLFLLGIVAAISVTGSVAYLLTRRALCKGWRLSTWMCLIAAIVSTIVCLELQRGPDRPIIGLVVVFFLNLVFGLVPTPGEHKRTAHPSDES